MANDTPLSSRPRNGGADPASPAAGNFRSWLRAALRGKSEGGWRDTIEDLIAENGDNAEVRGDDISSNERALLENILNLRTLTAYDVMVPRADIAACDVDIPQQELMELLANHPHSRLPVYRGTLDDALGFVHIKDILGQLARGGELRLADLVREVQIIAPSMPLLDLLLQMRQKRQHLALVVDEFGGIDGLITIEDVVEEIVGEIEDEHDVDEAPNVEERPDGSILADARLPIETFEALVGPIMDVDDPDDVDTLGGLVFTLAGRIPARGEVLTHPAGLEFEVIDADPRKIKRLRVVRFEAREGPVS